MPFLVCLLNAPVIGGIDEVQGALFDCDPGGMRRRGKTPAAIPTIVLGNNASTPQPNANGTGSLIASGIVVPAQESQLALRLGSNAKTVNISTGDEVQAWKFNQS